MMDSIAAVAMDMKAAEFAVDYSVAVTKKCMDTQEIAMQGVMRMLPPVSVKGEYIDTYA